MARWVRDGGRFVAVEWYGRPSHPRSLHIWFGGLGFHFFGQPIVEWWPGWRGSNQDTEPS